MSARSRFISLVRAVRQAVSTRSTNAFRFVGLGASADVVDHVQGRFTYGTGCGIETRAVVVVPKGTQLNLGDGVYIGRYVELGAGNRIDIGDGTSIQDRSILLGDVFVGRYCIFSPNVYVSSGTHYADLKPHWIIRDQDEQVRSTPALSAKHSRPVRIEDDCWIGANAVILQGVTIGKGSVIGANSVITRDIPPYSVVVGAPGRILRERLRFSPPRSLDATLETDLPYFYCGFGVSVAERREGAKLGGLLAKPEFSISLDIADATAISITARSCNVPCGLKFGGETRAVGHELTTATYGLGAERPQGPLKFFAVGTDHARWPICVVGASVL